MNLSQGPLIEQAEQVVQFFHKTILSDLAGVSGLRRVPIAPCFHF
jgi:hypothetical protein